jgi:hypothetical protein
MSGQQQFGLLDRLNIVPLAEQSNPYSVIIQPEIEFLVQLPPRAVKAVEPGSTLR